MWSLENKLEKQIKLETDSNYLDLMTQAYKFSSSEEMPLMIFTLYS